MRKWQEPTEGSRWRRLARSIAYLALASTCGSASAEDSRRILESVRRTAMEQVSRSSNYACVQTIYRRYLRDDFHHRAGCQPDNVGLKREILHDRLRLNMAVSKEGEIFSWHGEDKFTSSDISTVVHGGPISSGNFTGFLVNIFSSPAVAFQYRGHSREHGIDALKFEYRVPQSVSRFRVQGVRAKSAIVPYHGLFLVNPISFQLIRLNISASKIPVEIGICSSDSEVEYQLAWISGNQTVIPKVVKLEMTDDTQLDTVSRNEYSGCREFRAESKLRFDSPGMIAAANEQPMVETWLPGGLDIPVEIVSPIDEKTAYTGDSVQGNVLAPILDRQGRSLIPKGAVLGGVITQLQRFYQPESVYALQVQFNEVTFGHRTFRLRAVHEATRKDANQRTAIFGDSLAEAEQYEIDPGAILFRSSHLRLSDRFRGQWRTLSPETVSSHAPLK